MSKYRRNFIYIALSLIVVVIILNIISSPPPNELNTPSVIFAESSHEFKKLSNEIDALKALHVSHSKQISTLRNTILDLNEQIKTGHQPSHSTINEQQNNDDVSKNSPIKSDGSQRPQISYTFELIPEEDIIYPEITLSNTDVEDTPSSSNAILMKDTHNNNVIYDKDTGIIHGNPLLINECSIALTMDHEVNILSSISMYHNSFVPWFWSRESIGSVLQNKQFVIPSIILTSNTFDNYTSAIYVKVANSASKIMDHTLLTSTHLLQEISAAPNTRIRSKCAFTFVQHPITRFVAAYFEVNALLWKEWRNTDDISSLYEGITFHKVRDDLKGRLKAFVNDLRKFHYVFLWSFPSSMNVLSSQSGLLSFAQNDLDHVFKYEFMQKEYMNILRDSNDEFCIDESDDFIWNEEIEENGWHEMLMGFGINKQDLLDESFRKWMGLNVDVDYTHVDDLRRMDVLYVYDAMDYEIYSKVVEYYWQDFVCFDYAADYKYDVLDYLTLYQEEYPGFPVKNRTKTNWDLILQYYNSKNDRQSRH